MKKTYKIVGSLFIIISIFCYIMGIVSLMSIIIPLSAVMAIMKALMKKNSLNK